ncbi:MAG: AmmeMemoRadiSam system protein A [Firmicutes bacterium]|nr:AmmeMemoRadiSam system protein A [Bacillota bacterium]
MPYGYLLPHPPLIIPGVGKGNEIPDTRLAMQQIAAAIKEQAPHTLVIISPHSILYEDYFHIAPGRQASGNFGAFNAKNIGFSVEYDSDLAELIGDTAQRALLPAGGLGERQRELDHGILIPLYFLAEVMALPPIVRISLSGLSLTDHYRMGMCISQAGRALGRRLTVLASGDMSHRLKEDGPYGYHPIGPEFDGFVKKCIQEADTEGLLSISHKLSEQAAECGLRGLIMMLGALDGYRVESRLLCYEGPYGVGYLTAAFYADQESPSLLPTLLAAKNTRLSQTRQAEDAYTNLARLNTEHFVQSGNCLELPQDLPAELLNQKAGVFVSIKKNGRLRGCIGTISPIREHIAAEIIENSISAASRDLRFDPIQEDELADLTYSVDVLSPAEPIQGPEQLDVLRYGVIVSHGHKRGLLLPHLEGVDTVEQQIDIARQKAGISPHENYTLERFEVKRHT